MNFSIFDSGNLVASYADERAARDALAQLVADDADAAEDVALVSFDDAGMPVGEPVLGSAVRPRQPV